MKGTIRAWIGDAIGALCLFALIYALLWVPYVFAPIAGEPSAMCDPATEQCRHQSGQNVRDK